MQKIQILIIGTNKPIMETVARLIDKEEKWAATIAFTVIDALRICREQEFKLALICGGLTENEELQLKNSLPSAQPKLPIVKHYGGGSGLLYAEIYQALQ